MHTIIIIIILHLVRFSHQLIIGDLSLEFKKQLVPSNVIIIIITLLASFSHQY